MAEKGHPRTRTKIPASAIKTPLRKCKSRCGNIISAAVVIQDPLRKYKIRCGNARFAVEMQKPQWISKIPNGRSNSAVYRYRSSARRIHFDAHRYVITNY